MLGRVILDIGNDALGRALRIVDPPPPRRGDTVPDRPPTANA